MTQREIPADGSRQPESGSGELTNGPATSPSVDDLLTDLIKQAGLSRGDLAGRVDVVGEDPIVASRLKIGTASALALAAQGAVVAAIEERRSGSKNDVTVRVSDACKAVHGVRHLKQSGYSIGVNAIGPGNQFFRTADDRFVYITMVRNDQRNALLELLQCANSNASIADAVRRWRGEDLETACIGKGLPLTMVRTAEEWAIHPQGRWSLSRPVVSVEKLNDGPIRQFNAARRPLSDIRVVDTTQFLAGPNVGRTLAEHGADVLRISTPGSADYINFVLDTGFGKRSAYLDFKDSGDISHLKSLIETGDVFIHSFRPESLQRRGMEIERLVEKHPGLICVYISCYGCDGPWKDWIGYDPNAQAATGIATTEGSPDAPLRAKSLILADYITGFLGAMGTLAALIHQSREGGSYSVNISLAQTCSWIQSLGTVDPTRVAEEEPPILDRVDSVFGPLEFLAPVTQFSGLKAYWESPPVPLGSCKAEWLVRR